MRLLTFLAAFLSLKINFLRRKHCLKQHWVDVNTFLFIIVTRHMYPVSDVSVCLVLPFVAERREKCSSVIQIYPSAVFFFLLVIIDTASILCCRIQTCFQLHLDSAYDHANKDCECDYAHHATFLSTKTKLKRKQLSIICEIHRKIFAFFIFLD